MPLTCTDGHRSIVPGNLGRRMSASQVDYPGNKAQVKDI